MIIKSMTATFGKLDRAHLEFKDGLNLIQAPNESGKSTWCAFWKAMLYGIDTRDRDKKGHLADKNRYQPWSGAPMEGELILEWQGRDITIRRGPKGNTPFGSFSAVYTGTAEPVPGLTAQNCGMMLTGVGQEVFERSAFLGGSNLTVTAAPELERRIAALVSSGQEDVSFSQAESRLKEWINRRRVNRSVGLIPKLEQELEQISDQLTQLHAVSGEIARLEAERAQFAQLQDELTAEQEIHRRLARRELNRRYAAAGEELNTARAQLTALEREAAKYSPLPASTLVREAQGNLQYLKVLDDEIKQAEGALAEAEDAYVQAQIALQDEHFQGLTAEEASRQVEQASQDWTHATASAQRKKRAGLLVLLLGVILAAAGFVVNTLHPMLPNQVASAFCAALFGCALIIGAFELRAAGKQSEQAARIFKQYKVTSLHELDELLADYRTRMAAADHAADHAKTVRGALNDRKARRENTHTDLMAFVHSFAPQVTDLFGCSAALSRALSLEHELTLSRERVAERLRRREDLATQGGQDFDTLELLHTPERIPEETDRALGAVRQKLEQVSEALNQYRGRQNAMGDPAAVAARREALEEELTRRRQELDALTIAMTALKEANTRLQERFSPELNHLSSQYLARLTGDVYSNVYLSRELEGAASRPGDVLPHSALYLSRGTVDQLYLAVRLAVCRLCLPEKPPLVLDDALTSFDDSRLQLALGLLRELAEEQQILLFTCQGREGTHLSDLTAISL